MFHRTQAGWTAAILVISVLGFAPRAEAVNKTVLSTGPEGGVYAPVGKAIGEILDAAAEGEVFETRVVTSPGSVANLRRLSQGDAAMAIVQGDVLFHAVRGSNAFPEPLTGVRAIAVLFPEAVHLIARRDAGIEKLEDLLGKRVGLGATGSGTELTTQSILEAAGLSKEQLEPFRGSSSEALDALAAGTLDAAFVVSAIGAKRLVDRFQASELRLVSLGEKVVTRLAEATPYLSPSSIAQGIYRDRSDAATITASMDAIFVTTDEAPPELVHEALEQLDRNLEVLRATLPPGIPVMPERNVQSLPVPLHLGSMSYYQSRGVFERPIRVLTGLYIRDLWDFDIKHGFDVDFEVWFKWKGRLDAANDHLDFELANGEIHEVHKTAVEKLGGETRIGYRVRASVRGSFTLHDFPFDTQQLEIVIEHPRLTANELLFVPDSYTGSDIRNLFETGYRPDLRIGEWEIKDVRQDASTRTEPSDFGSLIHPGGERQTSRYVFWFTVHRNLVSYLLKFAVSLVLIAVMCYAVFFMHPEAYETGILVCIWVLFTAVEFQIYQAESLPDIGYLVTADKFFLWTYVSIFFTLTFTMLRYHLYLQRDEDPKRVKGFNRVGRLVFPIFFFGPIAALIWSSL